MLNTKNNKIKRIYEITNKEIIKVPHTTDTDNYNTSSKGKDLQTLNLFYRRPTLRFH